MAVELATAYISLVPSAKGITAGITKELTDPLEKAGDDAGDKSSKKFGSSFSAGMKKAVAVAAAAFTVAAVVDFGKAAINAASDLSESMGKVEVVFGDASGAVVDWSKSSATAFGQSQQAALEAAGMYGNLFQAFGLGQKPAQEMSTSLVELAADLASFNNTSVDDAILALRSGLSGETEPLKRYGVAINDARLKQEALALGLISSTKDALDPAAKAQASYSLIMKDTALAQGDFQRTSGGLSNQQRILSAQWKNAQASIGKALLPALTAVVSFLTTKVIPAFQWLVDHKPIFIATVTAIGVALAALFLSWTVGAASAAAATLVALAPFIAIGAAIAAVTAAVIWAYQNWDWFRTAVDAVASFFTDTLWPILQDVFSWLADVVPPIIETIAGFFTDTLLPAVQATFNWINDNVVPIFKAIYDFIVTYLLPAYVTFAEFMIGVYKTAIETAITVITTLWGWLQTLWDRSEGLRSFLASAFKAAVDGARLAFADLSTAVSTIWGWLQTLWDRAEPLRAFLAGAFWLAVTIVQTAFDAISTAVSTVWGWFQTIWDKGVEVAGYFEGPFKAAMDVAVAAWGAVYDAISSVLGVLGDIIAKAKEAVDALKDVVRVSLGGGLGVLGVVAGGGGGGGGSSGGAGGRASGGPVRAGETYKVGERGWEYFTPNVNGYVIDHETSAAIERSGRGVTVAGDVNIYDATDLDGFARVMNFQLAGSG